MLNPSIGEIVLVADVLDPQGRNPKDRPAVILASKAEPEHGQLFLAVAVTTLIPDPLPDNHVLLPWQRPRHPRTGLNKKCAAVGSWLIIIKHDQMIRHIGLVPGPRLIELADLVHRLGGEVGLHFLR